MKSSIIAVLLLVVFNSISSGADIIEFRELTSGLNNAGDLFEFSLAESDYINEILLIDSILYSDSAQRHFYYVIPSDCDPEELAPLFVWIHGGVSTADLRTMETETLMERYLIPRLLCEGYLIAFPCGQADAVWWDTVGEEGILRIVRWMKMNFSVDDSRIFIGGFSDGASGSFSLMMLHPSYFAGYLAFSGHIGVAAIDGGRATYLPSLSNRPGIVSHSDEDGLYPTAKMAPTIALAESAGAVIEYHTFQGFEHDPSYLPQMEDRIFEFLEETERVRFPGSIIWEAGEPSGCDWLMVDSIIPWPLIGGDLDYNTTLVSDRLRFGFYLDWEYEGDGVFVAGVADGDVPAARMGFQEGDVIIGFEGEDIVTLDDIGILQEGMLPGDSFAIAILRNGETLELQDMFNSAEYYWLLPRTGPSVRVEAAYSQNSFDINVNRFCVIRLLLHPEMVDFSSDIVVTCNGYEVFRGPVEENYSFAMENLMENLDLERCYTAELKLDLEELILPLM